MGCSSTANIEKEEKEERDISIELYILVKNLESKNVDPKEIKAKIEQLFEALIYRKEEEETKREEIIESISNIFIEYLQPINNHNKISIIRLINRVYKENEPQDKKYDTLKQYLINVLENINNYSNLTEDNEKSINEYLVRILKENEAIVKKKEEFRKIYKKNNYIIKYDDFVKIVKENKIEMENLVIEYLIYKMKCGLPLNRDLLLDNLNFKIFIDYLDRKEDSHNLKESNNIRESILSKNIENIGIDLKPEDSQKV